MSNTRGRKTPAVPRLRKGRVRSIVEGARDAAFLAVEIYNKPRTSFRTQGYVALMAIAWTRLFHAYFHTKMGDKYYYKEGRKYKLTDGERRAWDLRTCIDSYGGLSKAVATNLQFFILVRNKIEHRHLARTELDAILFGECQALLNNFERQLTAWFGEEYALNESLAFALQFSTIRTKEQKAANRALLTREARDIRHFIETFRLGIPDEVFASDEFSVKVIVMPAVSNTSRNDLAIQFVDYAALDDAEKPEYERLVALIKNRPVIREGANVGRLKPSEVTEAVASRRVGGFNSNDHTVFWTVFGVRPSGKAIRGGMDPTVTNPHYCLYDKPHKDHVYTQEWVEFIVRVLDERLVSLEELRRLRRTGESLSTTDYGGQ